MWVALLCVFIIVVVVAVLLPFFKVRKPWAVDSVERLSMQIDALADQKERALRKIKDLDLERESGALSEEEYEQFRQEYRQDVVLIQRKLLALQGGGGAKSKKPAMSQGGAK